MTGFQRSLTQKAEAEGLERRDRAVDQRDDDAAQQQQHADSRGARQMAEHGVAEPQPVEHLHARTAAAAGIAIRSDNATSTTGCLLADCIGSPFAVRRESSIKRPVGRYDKTPSKCQRNRRGKGKGA